jgi:hypothetical protein
MLDVLMPDHHWDVSCVRFLIWFCMVNPVMNPQFGMVEIPVEKAPKISGIVDQVTIMIEFLWKLIESLGIYSWNLFWCLTFCTKRGSEPFEEGLAELAGPKGRRDQICGRGETTDQKMLYAFYIPFWALGLMIFILLFDDCCRFFVQVQAFSDSLRMDK